MITYTIKKCDSRPIDFAQKCPQKAGNSFSGGMLTDPPRNVSSVWPNVPGAQNLSWPPQLNRSQHATAVHVYVTSLMMYIV